MKTWNISKIRTIYFSLADLWKENTKRGTLRWGRLWTNLLVTTVIILDDNRCFCLLVLLRLHVWLSRTWWTWSGANSELLPPLVWSVGLLDYLSRLIQFPLLFIRKSQIWQVLFTFSWSLRKCFDCKCFLVDTMKISYLKKLRQLLCCGRRSSVKVETKTRTGRFMEGGSWWLQGEWSWRHAGGWCWYISVTETKIFIFFASEDKTTSNLISHFYSWVESFSKIQLDLFVCLVEIINNQISSQIEIARL